MCFFTYTIHFGPTSFVTDSLHQHQGKKERLHTSEEDQYQERSTYIHTKGNKLNLCTSNRIKLDLYGIKHGFTLLDVKTLTIHVIYGKAYF